MKSIYVNLLLLLVIKGVVSAAAPDEPLYSFRAQTYCNSQCTITHYLESVYEQSGTDCAACGESIYAQSDSDCTAYGEYLYGQPYTDFATYSESAYAQSDTLCTPTYEQYYVYYIDTRTPALRFNITTSDESNQIKYNLVIKENVDGNGWLPFTDYTSATLPEGDVFYELGTTESKLVGNYGQESLYSWSIQAENPNDPSEKSSRLYNANGNEATPQIAFRVPPYFVAYKTDGNPILMGDVTKSSITLQVNTPYMLDRISVNYGEEMGTYTETLTKANQTGVIRFNLTNLAASTTYYYVVEWDAGYDGNVIHTIPENKFTTAKDNAHDIVRFAIITDSHQQQSYTYLRAGWDYENRLMPFFGTTLKNEDFDFVIDLGDYIPSERCLVQDEYDAFYTQELLLYQEMATPAFIVPGNHEGISPRYCNYQAGIVQYYPWICRDGELVGGISRMKYVVTPDEPEASLNLSAANAYDYNTFFSWESGGILFIALDPYTYTEEYPQNCVTDNHWTLGAIQQQWYENLLATSDHTWVVIVAHHLLDGWNRNGTECYAQGGVYSYIDDGNTYNKIIKPIEEHLLNQGKKNVIIFKGHDHLMAEEIWKEVTMVTCPTLHRQWSGSFYYWGYDNIVLRDEITTVLDSNYESMGWEKYIGEIVEAPGLNVNLNFDIRYRLEGNSAGPFPIHYKTEFGAWAWPLTGTEDLFLENVTRKSHARIISSSSTNLGDNEYILSVTDNEQLDFHIENDIAPAVSTWQVGDIIQARVPWRGYITVEVEGNRLTYYMRNLDNVEVPGTRKTLQFSCDANAQCDDGFYCNGTETCVDHQCSAGSPPCLPEACCDEVMAQCYPHAEDSDCDGVPDVSDNCHGYPNGPNRGTCTLSILGNNVVSTGQFCIVDADCDPGEFCDKLQADTYPPQGNGIGDACDCEADFNCDGSVDAGDVTSFLADFGRSTFFNPCTNVDPCYGDFDCNVNVDAGDINKFLEDFGRSQYFNPCPVCNPEILWCVYP